MKLRVIESGDRPQLEALFEKQGFEYILPDRDTLVAAIAVEDGGRIVQAVLARPTIELYFLMDAEWKSPALRMEEFRVPIDPQFRLDALDLADAVAFDRSENQRSLIPLS